MRVRIHLKETSQEIIHTEVENTYQKGDLFCIMLNKGQRYIKYPIQNIFRIIEE